VAGDKVFIVRDDKGFRPGDRRRAARARRGAEDVINNNRMRGEIDNALAALKLFSKDEKVRRDAIKTLQGEADESRCR
jgi:urea transport system permease protein